MFYEKLHTTQLMMLSALLGAVAYLISYYALGSSHTSMRFVIVGITLGSIISIVNRKK